MNKIFIIILIATFVFIGFFIADKINYKGLIQADNLALIDVLKQTQVCFKNYCFDIEIAETSAERSRGLMYKEHLDENKGMLFVFDRESIHVFWMKNTLIPLDIIWINKNKEIVFVKKNAQLCKTENCPTIQPDKEAKYVLEINAGMADKIGLSVGDRLAFEIDL